jgi:MFS transporter, DHA2 family, multidrug resistance protein
VLGTLILVAAIANLPLSVANVALPDIGRAFDASQTQLNLVAVGYSLGLATSVLWFGAIGDRYGRRRMLLIGVLLSLPAGILAAFAPTIVVLNLARLLGGVAAGMSYPTTLALITALWSGPGRTRAIALWSALGGAVAAIGPLLSGWLVHALWWGAVFLVTVPLIVVAVPLIFAFVPAHAEESTTPVDHLGGFLSVLLIGAIILAINFSTVPGAGMLVLVLGVIGIVSLALFVWRQRRAKDPLYDLEVAARPTFWVAAVAGVIVFGVLMAAMFIGQQFLQNVLGYSPLESGFSILPAAIFMVLLAPVSARLVESRGARFTLLAGYVFVLLGFLTMLFLWHEGIGYWAVGLGYAFVGAGVGLAGTPASHSLTGSVPVRRAGMASGTADLQRDLGGAVMQSILGVLLTAGYAHSFNALIEQSPQADQVSAGTQSLLIRSFSSAENIAQQYPQYADAVTQAAKESFLAGQTWAYLAGILAVLIGAALVFFCFPRAARERELLASYRTADAD